MMNYKVMHNYEDEYGWNEEELFSSESLEECVKVAQENGGWFSDEDYVNVEDENGLVVWE
jgi:HEPN domain-containing protein